MQADHANFSVLFALAALVLIWATSLLTQHLVMRLVRRMMMAPSDDLDAEATAGDAVQPVAASRSPEWVVLTAKSTLTDATATREAVVEQAQDEFKSALKHDLSIAAAYVIIPMAVYAWPGQTSWDGSFLSFLIGLLALLTLPFVSVMRYLAFRQQFRAYQSGLAGVFRPFATTWLEICKPKWRGLIAGIVITMALLNVYWEIVDGSWRTALGYSAAIAVHVYLLYRLMTMARRAPNLKLLVLRVFGFDDAAQFTFEGLLQ